MIYAFDVDGTITPSRGAISDEMRKRILEFNATHESIIVTGSDQAKTVEQIGWDVYDSFLYQFQCCGNQVFWKGEEVHRSDFGLTDDVNNFLQGALANSMCPVERAGIHIEERIGLINFSFCGRGVDQTAREQYNLWDNENKQRAAFCELFNATFPHLEAQAGGEISVDIFEKGKDKAQVRKWFNGGMTFFGDSIYLGGNDYTIAMECHVRHNVTGPQHLLEILNDYS